MTRLGAVPPRQQHRRAAAALERAARRHVAGRPAAAALRRIRRLPRLAAPPPRRDPGPDLHLAGAGRSRVTFAEWVRMDLRYIGSRSLWSDLKLVGRYRAGAAASQGLVNLFPNFSPGRTVDDGSAARQRASPRAPAGLHVQPRRGSEAGVGWNRAVESARHFDTWVICEEHEFAPEIRRYWQSTAPSPGLHFHFVPLQPWESLAGGTQISLVSGAETVAPAGVSGRVAACTKSFASTWSTS